MYFLPDHLKGHASAEVSIVSGRHKNARLSGGAISEEGVSDDREVGSPREIGRRRYELHSLRLDSIHVSVCGLRWTAEEEYFVPITNGAVFRAWEWILRTEFTRALRSEGQRGCAAHNRMSRLIKARESALHERPEKRYPKDEE
jgi:hypothetical protein